MKKIAILDILILALGYVLRVQYGGILADAEISGWLYMVVLSGAFYLGFGKRRDEIKMGTDTREVLKDYTYAFLDKNMYVCMELAIVFYSFWAVSQSVKMMRWTIPVFMMILMKYSLDMEDDTAGGCGDPVEVILKDKVLLAILIFYVITAAVSLYAA